MRLLPLAGACIVFAILIEQTRGGALSTFDVDADGWTTFQNVGAPFSWVSHGGNPGGHITATDKTADWAYVQAPAKFLTAATYGGTLSFDLRVDNLNQPGGFPGIFNVRTGLQGAGLTLINEGSLPTTTWSNYSFALNELAASGWRKFSNLSQNYSTASQLVTKTELQSVLANLTRFVIATDYTFAAIDNGISGQPIDQTFLDNVELRDNATLSSVPEPTSLVIFLGGACAVGLTLRRRRKCMSCKPG